MYQVIIVIHVLLGLGIIGLVLMQQGRGADAGAAFGSGGSGSVFGAQGSASFLSRTTAIFAALFFSTSLGLAFLSGSTTKAVDLMQESSTQTPKPLDIPAVGTSVPDPSQKPNVTESVPVSAPAAVPVPSDVPSTAPEASKKK